MKANPPPLRFSRVNPSLRSAFTLLELLVTVAIIGILSTFGYTMLRGSSAQALEVKCVANLRQIGIGLAGYTGDHNHRLPGPLLPSQGPRYNQVNGELAAYLASYLAPYLGIPEAAPGPLPTLEAAIHQAPMFYCPAFGRTVTDGFANAYLLRWRIPEMGTNMPPWGNYGTSIPQSPKTVLSIPDRASTWAVTDLDQLTPYLPAESWVSRAPARPVHRNNQRNALFFDWHVGKIAINGDPL